MRMRSMTSEFNFIRSVVSSAIATRLGDAVAASRCRCSINTSVFVHTSFPYAAHAVMHAPPPAPRTLLYHARRMRGARPLFCTRPLFYTRPWPLSPSTPPPHCCSRCPHATKSLSCCFLFVCILLAVAICIFLYNTLLQIATAQSHARFARSPRQIQPKSSQNFVTKKLTE